jgi:hypothetical protein
MNILCSEENRMISDEEKREIIEQAKQEFLVSLPDVIGNLMANHAMFAKMNKEFYQAHPEFKDHKEAVVSILGEVDGEDTLATYEEKLKKAIPRIQERIKVIKGLNMDSAAKTPNRHYPEFADKKAIDNGEL